MTTQAPTNTEQPKQSQAIYRAYISSLADYNAGKLVGKWIDLDHKTAGDIQHEINNLLMAWQVEEYAVHDWEGLSFGEYVDWEEVVETIEAIEEHGDAFKVYWEYDKQYHNIDVFTDNYAGVYDSKIDWAENFVEDCYDLPEIAQRYFDYDAFARDAEIDGILFLDNGNGGVFVFHSS